MNFDNMNNNVFNDDNFSEARKIIAEAQRFRPMGICCPQNINNGVTGPTGPTHTILSESKWYFLTIFLI